MKRMLIPQREFAFVADTFGLIQDCALDGDRLARERDEMEAACRASDAAQRRLFAKRKTSPVKAKRHARQHS